MDSASTCSRVLLSCYQAVVLGHRYSSRSTATMKAVVYDSPNVVKVVEKDIPTAGEGEAVVRVS